MVFTLSLRHMKFKFILKLLRLLCRKGFVIDTATNRKIRSVRVKYCNSFYSHSLIK